MTKPYLVFLLAVAVVNITLGIACSAPFNLGVGLALGVMTIAVYKANKQV